MQVVPAHSIEAIKMADSLMNEFLYNDFTFKTSTSIEVIEPVSSHYQDLLAVGFGWQSWSEMIEVLKVPHEPVYLDDDETLLDLVALRLSQRVGYDSAQGIIYHFIENTGIGYSPIKRRELQLLASPWGIIKSKQVITSGIEKIKTISHGGYSLDEHRLAEMPKHLVLDSHYYEEKVESALVEIAFPQLFPEKQVGALAKLNIYKITPYQSSGMNDAFSSIDCELCQKSMTEAESEVIKYLSLCVLQNCLPIKSPADENPTLQDWVNCLSMAFRVNGEWPLMKMKWKRHFYR